MLGEPIGLLTSWIWTSGVLLLASAVLCLALSLLAVIVLAIVAGQLETPNPLRTWGFRPWAKVVGVTALVCGTLLGWVSYSEYGWFFRGFWSLVFGAFLAGAAAGSVMLRYKVVNLAISYLTLPARLAMEHDDITVKAVHEHPPAAAIVTSKGTIHSRWELVEIPSTYGATLSGATLRHPDDGTEEGQAKLPWIVYFGGMGQVFEATMQGEFATIAARCRANVLLFNHRSVALSKGEVSENQRCSIHSA